MDEILARLRHNESRMSSSASSAPIEPNKEPKTINKLLTNLSGHSQALNKQRLDLIEESDSDGPKDEGLSSGSDLYTPATESFDIVSCGDQNTEVPSQLQDSAEIVRVKQELAAAKSTISRQEQELAETRKLKHTMDQAMGPPSEADFAPRADISEQAINHLQSAFNASARPFTSRSDTWHPHDIRPDESDALSAGGYQRGRGIWSSPMQPPFAGGINTTAQPSLYNDQRGGLGSEWATDYGNQTYGNQNSLSGNQRIVSGSGSAAYGFDGRYGNEQIPLPGSNIGLRRTVSQFQRGGPNFGNRANAFGGYPSPLPNFSPASIGPMGIPTPMGYQPGPVGSPLSPTMSSFTSGSLPAFGSPWSSVSLIFSFGSWRDGKRCADRPR
jgi:hypothetical protein